MATNVCWICEQPYERGTYRAHLDKAHPTQRLSTKQLAQLAQVRGAERWTAEMAQDLHRRYLAGESVKALGAEYGVSDARIRQVFVKYGIQLRPEGRVSVAPTPEVKPLHVPSSRKLEARAQLIEKYGDQWGKVVRLRSKGKSLVAVANEVGSAQTTR